MGYPKIYKEARIPEIQYIPREQASKRKVLKANASKPGKVLQSLLHTPEIEVTVSRLEEIKPGMCILYHRFSDPKDICIRELIGWVREGGRDIEPRIKHISTHTEDEIHLEGIVGTGGYWGVVRMYKVLEPK